MKSWKNTLWGALLTVLGIACFPANPLVLAGVIEVRSYLALFIIGWVVWVFGMVLVVAPFVMFPRLGGVGRGKSYVHTTQLVRTGIYAVVRHPQYTGGIYAIFLTTFLWYPHWLFGLLGVIGTAVIFLGCRKEDKLLVVKFGKAYEEYMEEVPGMNYIAGFLRLLRRRRLSG